MTSRRLVSAEHSYFCARADVFGNSMISCSPVSKMWEKSHIGGAGGVSAPAGRPAGGVARPAAAAPACGGMPKFVARPACPPTRPPERLKNPSTFVAKKGLQMIREQVSPPCECPASQNALTFCLPIVSITDDTMFCKYSSSCAAHTRRGENGVATTSRYLSV